MLSFISFVCLIFLTFSTKGSHAQVQCMDSPFPFKYSSDSVCNSPHILDSTLSSFPTAFRTGATVLTFDVAATIISVCPGITDNIELFSLTINKPSDNSLLQISRVYYQQSTNYYHFTGSLGGTTKAMKDKYKVLQLGNSFQYFMKISLETTTNNARGTLTLSGYYDSSVYIGTNSFGYFYNSITSLPISSTDKVLLGPFTNPTVSIHSVKIFSPGAYSPRSISTCSTPKSYCSLSLGSPNIENCLTCQTGTYMKNFYCLQECYIYSDGSCKMQCSHPYVPRNETLAAYCDFKCGSTNQYLYPDGSCLSTCPSPAVKYQNLTNEWYCKGPCEDANKFYYSDQKVCLTSCSENYDEDYTLFYKRCILTKVSETIKSTIEVTDKAGTASRAITQATTALSSGIPTGISTSIAGKIFSNIKFLNISYSVGLQEALLTWKSTFINLEFMPDMPESLQDNIVSQSVPYMFEKYNIQSSFLLNFWNNLLLLVFLTLIFISIKAIEYLITHKKYQEKVIIIRAMLQNFLISQLYSVYGDILFYSTIEYRSMNLHEGLTGLSFAFAIILTSIIISSLILHFLFLRNYQRIKKTQSSPEVLDKFIKDNEGNFVLFRDFKDRLLIQQSFLLLLTARDLACSILITTIFRHPLAQSIIILVLNLLMIAYLILKNPFVSLFDYIQQFFYEFITLTVSVNVLILTIMDSIDSQGKELRTNIGNFIISTNLCFNFGALGFMLVKGWFVVKEIYDNYQAKRQLKKNPKIKHQRPESRGPGPFLKESTLTLSEKASQDDSLIKSLSESQTPLNVIEAQKKEDSLNITKLEGLEIEDLEISSPDLQQSLSNLKASLQKPTLNRRASSPETEPSNGESIDNNEKLRILKKPNLSSNHQDKV